jgi:excisionase family DNA binding protein
MCMHVPRTQKTSALEAATYSNVDELARELGLGRLTVYAALRNGTIPSIRVGKRYILPRSAIAEWLKSAGRSVEGVTG